MTTPFTPISDNMTTFSALVDQWRNVIDGYSDPDVAVLAGRMREASESFRQSHLHCLAADAAFQKCESKLDPGLENVMEFCGRRMQSFSDQCRDQRHVCSNAARFVSAVGEHQAVQDDLQKLSQLLIAVELQANKTAAKLATISATVSR